MDLRQIRSAAERTVGNLTDILRDGKFTKLIRTGKGIRLKGNYFFAVVSDRSCERFLCLAKLAESRI